MCGDALVYKSSAFVCSPASSEAACVIIYDFLYIVSRAVG